MLANYFFRASLLCNRVFFLTGIIGPRCRVLIRFAFLLNENIVNLQNKLISRVLNAPHKTRSRLAKIPNFYRYRII